MWFSARLSASNTAKAPRVPTRISSRRGREDKQEMTRKLAPTLPTTGMLVASGGKWHRYFSRPAPSPLPFPGNRVLEVPETQGLALALLLSLGLSLALSPPTPGVLWLSSERAFGKRPRRSPGPSVGPWLLCAPGRMVPPAPATGHRPVFPWAPGVFDGK